MKKPGSQVVLSFTLALVVGFSAMALVSVRQLNRLVFYDLLKLERQRDYLSIEWRQLMAEFSTWRLEHNIENEVRGAYSMEPPAQGQIQTIFLASSQDAEITGRSAQ